MRKNPKNISAPKLTQRETEVLAYISKGFKNKEIAQKLYIDVKTVETHKFNLIRKLDIRNTRELIIYAALNLSHLIALILALLPQDIF